MTSGKVQMREFLQDAVSRYMEETGERTLAAVRTPYLPENFSPKGGEEPGALAKTCSSDLMTFYLLPDSLGLTSSWLSHDLPAK